MSVVLTKPVVPLATRTVPAPTAARPRPEAGPEEIFRRVRALLGERHTAEAMGTLRPALERFPRDPALKYLAALAFARLGDEMHAALSLGEALKLAPGQPVLLLRRALFLLGSGDPEQAKSLLSRLAMDRHPEVRAEASRVLRILEATGLGQARHLPVLDLDPEAEQTLLGAALPDARAVVRPEAVATVAPVPAFGESIGLLAVLITTSGVLAWSGHGVLGAGCAAAAAWWALKKS